MKKWVDRTLEEKVEILHKNDMLDTVNMFLIAVSFFVIGYILIKLGGL
jgi:hypothetical protein